MICPHCKYEHGWRNEQDINIIGDKGGFYQHPVEVKRREPWSEIEMAEVYACPSCGILFIDVN